MSAITGTSSYPKRSETQPRDQGHLTSSQAACLVISSSTVQLHVHSVLPVQFVHTAIWMEPGKGMAAPQLPCAYRLGLTTSSLSYPHNHLQRLDCLG